MARRGNNIIKGAVAPMFSIIIPAFNVQDFLKYSLESLFRQSFENWECICIDDGSIDDTGRIADEWGAKDRRIKIVHTKNNGVSIARNIGLEKATGKYLLFLDADDAFVPNALESLDWVIKKMSFPDIIKYDIMRVVQHKEYDKIVMPCTELVRCTMNGAAPLKRTLKAFFMRLLASSACYSRKTFKVMRFERISNGEDVLWGVDCLLHANSIVYLPVSLYRYLTRSGSAATTIDRRHLESVHLCTRKIADRVSENQSRFSIGARIMLFKRILCQMLGYVQSVQRRISLTEQSTVGEDYVKTLKYVCTKVLGRHCWGVATIFKLIVSNSALRSLFLDMPFNMLKKRSFS